MPVPIVLAIEPDRRQAAHVSAVVRHRVGAELILADTTEAALDAIGNRVPDLVLVPALLSPQDDAALAAALRVIAAAAHVRTLTIPVFANTAAHDGGGGLLSRLRRGRSESSPVGCDPAVFAEQISEYLREAAADRADREAARRAPPRPAPTPVDRVPVVDSPPIASAEVASPEPLEPLPIESEYFDSKSGPWPIYVPPSSLATSEPPTSEPFAASNPPQETPPSPLAVGSDASTEQWSASNAPSTEQWSASNAPSTEQWYASSESSAAESLSVDEPVLADAVVAAETSIEPVAVAASEPTLLIEPSIVDAPVVESLTPPSVESLEADPVTDEEPIDPEIVPVRFIAPAIVTRPRRRREAVEQAPPALDFGDAAAAEFGARAFVEPLPAPDRHALKEEPHEVVEISSDADIAAWAASSSESQESAIDEFKEYLATVEKKPVDEAAWLTLGLRFTRQWPVMEGPIIKSFAAREQRVDTDVASAPPIVPSASPKPAGRPDHLDWADLVASLRQDIERRRKHPAAPPAPKATAAPKPEPLPQAPEPPPQPRPRLHAVDPAAAGRPRKPSPIQDEWGFFDPQQCGFAALLEKLDEFNEAADEPEVRKTS